MKQNYREDFILTLTLNSISEQFGGEPLAAFPQSFSIALQTTPAAAAVCVSSTDGVLSGCHFAEDDPLTLHIPIRGGSLMPGQLRGTFRCQVDDPCFPDGCRSLNIPFTTAVTLVTDASDNAELIPSTGVPSRSLSRRPTCLRSVHRGKRSSTCGTLSAMSTSTAISHPITATRFLPSTTLRPTALS